MKTRNNSFKLSALSFALTAALSATAQADPSLYEPTWSNVKRYTKGNLVEYNSTYYRSLRNNKGVQPNTNRGMWEVVVPPFGAGITLKGVVWNKTQLVKTPYGGKVGDTYITARNSRGFVWNGKQFTNIGVLKNPASSSFLKLTGTVPTPSDLPSEGNNIGDFYISLSDNHGHLWTGVTSFRN